MYIYSLISGIEFITPRTLLVESWLGIRRTSVIFSPVIPVVKPWIDSLNYPSLEQQCELLGSDLAFCILCQCPL